MLYHRVILNINNDTVNIAKTYSPGVQLPWCKNIFTSLGSYRQTYASSAVYSHSEVLKFKYYSHLLQAIETAKKIKTIGN